jgi:osmotically-inducible protein OsmY
MSNPQSGRRQYPSERYYYGWYGGQEQLAQPGPQTDGQIKSEVVDRLRQNAHTKDHTLDVNVQSGVVVLTGDVSTVLAKRAAGDDSWDTPGVVDVSNQLRVVRGS